MCDVEQRGHPRSTWIILIDWSQSESSCGFSSPHEIIQQEPVLSNRKETYTERLALI